MGIDIYTNEQDSSAILFCNTADEPIPSSLIWKAEYHEGLEDDPRGAREFADDFLKWCYENHGDPRSMGEDGLCMTINEFAELEAAKV